MIPSLQTESDAMNKSVPCASHTLGALECITYLYCQLSGAGSRGAMSGVQISSVARMNVVRSPHVQCSSEPCWHTDRCMTKQQNNSSALKPRWYRLLFASHSKKRCSIHGSLYIRNVSCTVTQSTMPMTRQLHFLNIRRRRRIILHKHHQTEFNTGRNPTQLAMMSLTTGAGKKSSTTNPCHAVCVHETQRQCNTYRDIKGYVLRHSRGDSVM